MMVMETRQQIEEAESQEDLMALQQTNEAKRRDCIQILSEAFGKEDLDLVEELVTQLRYLTTAGDAISLKL
ncbi:hypothetical protein WJX84_008302 [Apatococcus fuscideae]|uniref:Co-chaperone HscB C-terminal oligomerisation domain-containing protein n=1 Tax=Apatococcus fuscideae TaxID=2026836 RepID=A0AAW1SG09_9CHLO